IPMKKLLLLTTFSTLLSAAILFAVTKIYLDPKLKLLIEQHGSEALNGRVIVGQVETKLLPLKIHLTEVSIEQAVPNISKLNIRSNSAELGVDLLKLLSKTAAVQIKLTKPQISYESLTSSSTQDTTKQTTTIVSPSPLEKLKEQPY